MLSGSFRVPENAEIAMISFSSENDRIVAEAVIHVISSGHSGRAVYAAIFQIPERISAATVPVLLLVTAGVFALLHLTPGDPIDAMMAESVDATAKASLRAELGLD